MSEVSIFFEVTTRHVDHYFYEGTVLVDDVPITSVTASTREGAMVLALRALERVVAEEAGDRERAIADDPYKRVIS